MKFINSFISNSKDLFQRAAVFFNGEIKSQAVRLKGFVRYQLVDQPDVKDRNRKLILLFAGIFFLDYLMYCLHTNSAPFEIFPTLPSLAERRDVTVYLPALDGATIIRERASVPLFDSDEKIARELFCLVARGSMFENTSRAVPVEISVKKVWLYGKGAGRNTVCVFDVEPVELDKEVQIISNSEALFKRALEKTIKENIPRVNKVLVLEKGVPGAKLWEI